MATKIDKLLAKKGWTGEEVGKALLASVIYDVKHMGEPGHKTLFSQEDFNRMEDSLVNRYDITVYSVYRTLYSAIIESFNRGQALHQQFSNGYHQYLNDLTACMDAEKAKESEETHTPLILTESQYNRYMETLREKNRNKKESFISLIWALLESFLEEPENAPENIYNLLLEYEKEPAANQRLLETYNEEFGRGYYQLPDGRRSDQLSPTAWKLALLDLKTADYKLVINGKEATQIEAAERIDQERQLTAFNLLFNGIDAIKARYKELNGEELQIEPEEEPLYLDMLEKFLGFAEEWERQNIESGRAIVFSDDKLNFIRELIIGKNKLPKWHNYDTPPQLNKYELLVDCTGDYFNGETEEEEKAHYEEFKKDYPALNSAMEAYIKEKVTPLRNYKPAQYFTEAISWGELAELNVGNYRKIIEPNLNIDIIELLRPAEDEEPDEISKRYRQKEKARRGIAILQKPSSYQVDSSGDYKEPESPLALFENIYDVANDTETREKLIACQENLIKPALRFIYAYNKLMDIIGEVYGIEELEVMQLDTKIYENKIAAFNSLIYLFYGTVFGSKAERKHKRGLIKEIYTPIVLEELKPTEESIAEVKKTLLNYGFTPKTCKELKYFDSFIATLSGEGA